MSSSPKHLFQISLFNSYFFLYKKISVHKLAKFQLFSSKIFICRVPLELKMRLWFSDIKSRPFRFLFLSERTCRFLQLSCSKILNLLTRWTRCAAYLPRCRHNRCTYRALKFIWWGSLFLDQLHDFLLLSLSSFLHPFLNSI